MLKNVIKALVLAILLSGCSDEPKIESSANKKVESSATKKVEISSWIIDKLNSDKWIRKSPFGFTPNDYITYSFDEGKCNLKAEMYERGYGGISSKFKMNIAELNIYPKQYNFNSSNDSKKLEMICISGKCITTKRCTSGPCQSENDGTPSKESKFDLIVSDNKSLIEKLSLAFNDLRGHCGARKELY